MRRARLWAVATLMLAEAVALPAAAQTGSTATTGTPSADVVARADALFQDALKLYKAKKYAEAERGFLAAWALNPTYDVSGNLAYVEYHLGKYRDAAEFFEFTLRNFPVTAKADRRIAAQKKLDEVRKLVASVTVDVSKPRAEVRVDGKPIGVSPLPSEVFLDPGAHTIEARLEGHELATQTIQADKGSAQTIKLVLVPAAPAAPLAAAGGSDPARTAPNGGPGQVGGDQSGKPVTPDPTPRRSPVPGIVLGAAGGAVLLTGVGLAAAYASKKSDADSLSQTIVSSGGYCNAPTGNAVSQCAQLHSATSTATTFGRAGVGMLVGGAALVAASGAYFLWPQSAPKPSGMTAAPIALPNGGGVLVQGSF